MIIGQFYKGYTRQLVWILLLGILLWINNVVGVTDISPKVVDGNYLMVELDRIMSGNSLVYSICLLVFVFIQAFLVTSISGRNYFLSRSNLLPAALYVIFIETSLGNGLNLEVLIVNLFLLAFLSLLTRLESDQENLSLILNASTILGIGSLFYKDLAFYIVFGWSALWVLRIFRWREWVIIPVGFLIPHLFAFTISYWVNGNTEYLFNLLPVVNFYFDFKTYDPTIIELVFGFIMVIIGLISMIWFLLKNIERTVKVRRAGLILLNFTITTLVVFVISNLKIYELYRLLCIPLALTMSVWLDHVKKTWIRETIMAIILIFVFLINWL
jgi:hypothetical protein